MTPVWGSSDALRRGRDGEEGILDAEVGESRREVVLVRTAAEEGWAGSMWRITCGIEVEVVAELSSKVLGARCLRAGEMGWRFR